MSLSCQNFEKIINEFKFSYLDSRRITNADLKRLKKDKSESEINLIDNLHQALVNDDILSLNEIDAFNIPSQCQKLFKQKYQPTFNNAWVKQYIPQISNQRGFNRVNIVRTIGKLDFSQTNPVLIQGIQTGLVKVLTNGVESQRLTEESYKTLSGLKSPNLLNIIALEIKTILSKNKDKEIYLPRHIISILGNLNKSKSNLYLMTLLSHKKIHKVSRDSIAHELGKNRFAPAINAMINYIYNFNSLTAVDALANIGTQEAINHLKSLRSENQNKLPQTMHRILIRTLAHRRLAKTDPSESHQFITGKIKSLESTNSAIQLKGIQDLYELKEELAIPHLLNLINIDKEPNAEVRKAASEAYIFIIGARYKEIINQL
ncbi:hypothetical protein BVY03_02865 [bacterium K02(2017)]|nr:hypothetical protein BVY03_02865 [bacterium K02(2017)]